MTATNKLTIYLIKDRFKNSGDIIKHAGSVINIPGVGNFFTENSSSHDPYWVDNFFKGNIGQVRLYIASAKGILLTSIKSRNKTVFFAISFGAGRHMLHEETIQEGFGLRVTLNSMHPSSIRSLEKSNIGPNSKMSKEQMSRSTTADDFGIDIEQDLLRTVTGTSKFGELGKTISGSDALSVSVKVDIDNIKPFLQFVYKRYTNKDYLVDFEWIDQIHHIKNPGIIEKLETTLLKRYNDQNFNKLWMAIPDLLEWSELAGFKYLPKQENYSDDIDIIDFRASIGEIDSLDKIRNRRVEAISAVTDSVMGHWNAFKCLYGEVEHQRKQYIINNGKWYEINKDFVKRVNEAYARIKLSGIPFPDYDHENEGEYNTALAASDPHYLLMDKKEIMHGGGKSKIEFCDVYSKDKKMIHIKHYGASAVLSHLFQQGMNSGEYLTSDPDFRKKLNEKLDPGWKLKNPESRINTETFEVIFGIISRNAATRPSIPFFSKVSIKNVVRRLEGFKYKVSIKRIQSLR